MKLNILTLTFSFILCSFGAFAQMDPVSWEAKLVKRDDGNYLLKLTANTEAGWVVYSQFLEEGGPIPTKFEVQLEENSELIGDFLEPNNGIREIDELFDMEVIKFKGPAEFTQVIRSTSNLNSVNGTIEYMTCDNKRCLPPKVIDFTAVLN